MLVTCKNCSTRFSVPDEKIAGKRAKMKCKKCGEAVLIDGTALPSSVAASDVAVAQQESVPLPPSTNSHWSVSSPSGTQGHVSLEELTERYLGGDLEPGTLVRAPGRSSWKPPYDQPEIAAHGVPAEKPASSRTVEELLETREKSISFSDETKALSADEVASLKLASQTSHEIPEPFDEKTPAIVAAKKPNSFFEDSDVEEAMGLFSNVFSEPPPASASAQDVQPPKPRVPEVSASSVPARPVAPAPRSAPPTPPQPRPSAVSTAAPPPTPSAPPFPGAPRPASAAPFPGAPVPPSAPARPTAPAYQSAPPLEVPKPPVPDAPLPPLGAAADLASLGSLTAPSTGFGKPASTKKSRTPLIIVLFLLLVALAFAGVYFLRPALLKPLRLGEASHTTTTTSGLSPERALDTNHAALVLAEASSQLDHCAEPGGPTGPGRVNVLFGASGAAKTAQVSAPFTHTSVGSCIVAAYAKTRVAAFSGPDVIVQTTFTLR